MAAVRTVSLVQLEIVVHLSALDTPVWTCEKQKYSQETREHK